MPSSLARSPERDLLRRNRNTGRVFLHVFATQPFFLLLETRLDSRFTSKPICRAFPVLRLLQLSFVALAPGVSPVSPPRAFSRYSPPWLSLRKRRLLRLPRSQKRRWRISTALCAVCCLADQGGGLMMVDGCWWKLVPVALNLNGWDVWNMPWAS